MPDGATRVITSVKHAILFLHQKCHILHRHVTGDMKSCPIVPVRKSVSQRPVALHIPVVTEGRLPHAIPSAIKTRKNFGMTAGVLRLVVLCINSKCYKDPKKLWYDRRCAWT